MKWKYTIVNLFAVILICLKKASLLQNEISESKKNCTSNEDCWWIKNSRCFIDKCECKFNYISFGENECVEKVSYGSSCNNSVQCSGVNIQCDKDKYQCLCRSSHYYNERLNRCYRKKRINDCNSDIDCSEINNSFCNESKTCDCKYNHVFNGWNCLEIVSLGNICEETIQCINGESYTFCNALEKRCVCRAGYIKNSDGTACTATNDHKSNSDDVVIPVSITVAVIFVITMIVILIILKRKRYNF